MTAIVFKAFVFDGGIHTLADVAVCLCCLCYLLYLEVIFFPSCFLLPWLISHRSFSIPSVRILAYLFIPGGLTRSLLQTSEAGFYNFPMR